MKRNETVGLIVRYLALVLLGLFNLKVFYLVFTPMTVYPVFWFASLLDSQAVLQNSVIFFRGFYAEIIAACVAGAAYYFLLVLNLTTPMQKIKRVKSILFLVLAFLFVNILRIIAFLILFANGYRYFDSAHNSVWYFGSTILVVLLWFVNVFLFKVKTIPVYSDITKLIKETKPKDRGAR